MSLPLNISRSNSPSTCPDAMAHRIRYAGLIGQPPRSKRGAMWTTTHTVAVACMMLIALQTATAQPASREPKPGLSGSLGFGLASMPTYEGSPNRRSVAVPFFTLNYRTQEWGDVSFGKHGLVWHAIDNGGFRLGLVTSFDDGRKDRKPSSSNPVPGDDRLAGMGTVKSSTEAGVLLGYGPFSAHARKSLGNRGHQGSQVDVNAEWPLVATNTVSVSVGAGLTWADKAYMQTYFGVTPAQSSSSGYRTFTPKAGLRKFEVSVNAEYALAKDWKLQGTLALGQLTGDAADSPLVKRKTHSSLAAGVAYVF